MDTWFIAEGRLHRVDGSGAIEAFASPFVEEALRRDERGRQLEGWKTAAPDDDSGRLVPRSALWGARSAGAALQPRFRHVVRASNDAIYYAVTLGSATALFRYDVAERREVRLFHGASFACLGIAADPTADRLVLATGNTDGTANLEIVDGEGARKGAVTSGDAIDASPSFSAHEPGVVVYQSSGVARHAQTGHAAAIGPAAILRLDLASAKLEPIVESADFDCLAPKMDRSGNLWYIRRPYERTAGEVALSAGKDALMFPWRVAKGLFGFLDAFSKVYGREPLKRSGGPQLPGGDPDLGALWLHGRMLSMNEVHYDAGRGGGLVPRSWELVCRNRRGQEYVAARHVAGFDVSPDDTVLQTNGFELSRLVDGDWRPVAKGKLVESVCAGSARA